MDGSLTRLVFVQIAGPKVLMSTLLIRTQITLCLCKDLPFTKSRPAGAWTRPPIKEHLLRDIHACVIQKRLLERPRNGLKQPQGRLKKVSNLFHLK